MLASECGYADIVALLLQAVADVDAKDMVISLIYSLTVY
jgi:hypothetical protein